MSRLRDRSGSAFGLVLVLTIATAFLPAPFRVGWQGDVARVVLVPVRPFAHAGNLASSVVMPDPDLESGVPPAIAERLRVMEREVDIARTSFLAERSKRLDLERQLEQIEALPLEVRGAIRHPRLAQVSRRSRAAVDGPVELVVSGDSTRVPTGSVAVRGGVHLLGRTVESPVDGPAVCVLLPLVHEDTGFVGGVVLPGNDPERSVVVHLQPAQRGGVLTGDIDARAPSDVVGSVVRLEDPGWPLHAQQMILGTVTARRTKDSEPLRDEIEVTPKYRVRDLALVTLLSGEAPLEAPLDERVTVVEPGRAERPAAGRSTPGGND